MAVSVAIFPGDYMLALLLEPVVARVKHQFARLEKW
jgi:hypothetical protein